MRFIPKTSHFSTRSERSAPDGVDVVYDLVGHATFAQSVQAVRDGRRIITIGAASGKPQFDPNLLAARRIEVKGGGTRQYVNARTVTEAPAELFTAIRRGLFRDLAVARYALAEAAQAHHGLERRTLTGLPVLIPL